jgi:hypothetical protein
MKFKSYMKYRTATLLALSLLVSSVSAKDVSVRELLARPQHFNGKRVAVTGYYLVATETSCLFTTREAAKHFDASTSLWVEFRAAPKVDSIANRRARLVGTFHYDPTVRAKVLHAYGNLWSAALLDVTEFRPIR